MRDKKCHLRALECPGFSSKRLVEYIGLRSFPDDLQLLIAPLLRSYRIDKIKITLSNQFGSTHLVRFCYGSVNQHHLALVIFQEYFVRKLIEDIEQGLPETILVVDRLFTGN